MSEQVHLSSKGRNALFFVVHAALSLAIPAFGQPGSPAQQITPARFFAYDVVSIKPHRPGDGAMFLGPTREGYQASNVMISLLVRDAFNLTKLGQIDRLPGWATDARFDVEAKMDEQTVAEFRKLSHEQQWRQRQLMLQAVLADRFRLSVHRDTKVLPVYALVVAKGGAKLKVSYASDGWWSWSGPEIVVHAEPMPILAMCLSKLSDVDRVVVDETGLTGEFDLDLKWTPEDEQARPDAGPTIFTAIEEQLGLKLVPAKGPVDVIVVDHVERPSEN